MNNAAAHPIASEEPATLPCSPAQLRIWIMDRMQPGSTALNIAVRWKIEGHVTNAEIGTAFERITLRHRALRSCFVEVDGRPVQMIHPSVRPDVRDIDLSHLQGTEADGESEALAQAEAEKSFDLSAAPLLRITHLRLSESTSIVLVTAHRIVCDQRSMEVMASELSEICVALQNRAMPDKVELPFEGGDRTAPHSMPSLVDRRSEDEIYWADRLKSHTYFEVQPDHPRPPVQTSIGNRVSRVLSVHLTDEIAEVSRRSGSSVFAMTFSAFLTLLHRYTGERDISIGSGVEGRKTPELQDAVGLFSDTVVLRSDLSGDPTFLDLARRVRLATTTDLAHQGAPLERIIELLKPVRDLSRSPLFSVLFTVRRARAPNAESGSFRLIELPGVSSGALHELSFELQERPEGWLISCDYNSVLFERQTAVGLLGHFVNLLYAAVRDPMQRISTMPMLGADELKELVVRGNQAIADYPRESTVTQLFAAQALLAPDSAALVCGDHSMSYGDLDLASNRLAHRLQGRGIGLGKTVAVCLDRSFDLVVALLAILKAGAHYVPLDPGYPSARLAQILEDAQPTALLTVGTLLERVPAGLLMTVLLDHDAGLIAQQSNAAVESCAGPDDLAYVMFTSGSTGRPKGVQIQHRSLTNLLWAMREAPGLTATDTLLAVTTVSFDIAALEIFLPLIVGARLVIAESTDLSNGQALLGLLDRHQVTVMQATPVTWQMLLAAGWTSAMPLKMLCGGEALSRSLADNLLRQGGQLWNLYGPTETTIWSSALRITQGTGPVPIGPAIANTRFHVLDDHAQSVPDGVPGELYIGGDGVAAGYLNLPVETARRFVLHRFNGEMPVRLYRTGDRVRTRVDGGLDFLGRADGQIKLRGFRIELGEIESVLLAQAGVADCVAIVARDTGGDDAIRAYVVSQGGGEATTIERLRQSLRIALPAYMCPSSITLLAALPRTPNGKIDRAMLPAPAAEVIADPGQSGVRPGSDPQARLKAIWCSILGLTELGVDDNFFEVGGHSLLAVRLLVRIEAEFGQQLSLAALFGNPTIAEQARLLAGAALTGEDRAFDFRQVLKLQPNGSRQPLIAINNTGIYYALSKSIGQDQPFITLQLFDPAHRQGDLPHTLEEIASGYAELIRRVQPTGPYALLGWCVAGTLAFETARQLMMDGHKVSHLMLFDTMAPGHLRRMPWWKALLAEYAYRWKLILGDWEKSRMGAKSMVTFLGNRTQVRKLMRALRRPVAVDAAIPGLDPDDSEAITPEKYDRWLLQYLEDTAESYRPKFYSGPVTLFRSSQEPSGRFIDPQMGWADFVEGRIDVVVIDGDHFSIFQEPRVSKLADRIVAAMDAEPERISSMAPPRTSTRIDQPSPSRGTNGNRLPGIEL